VAACREVFEETNLVVENLEKIGEKNVFYANYPKESREKIEEIHLNEANLEGELDLSDFTNH